MGVKLFNKLLALILTSSFTLPASLFAGSSQPTVDTKIVSKWNRMRKNWLTLKTPTQVETELARMNLNYNPRFEKKDKKYMEALASQTTELPEIKVKGDSYEIFDKKASPSTVKIQSLGQNKFLLNGKAFEYDINSSLETNLEKIKPLLESEKVSFWDQVFLPSANALVQALAIGTAIATAAIMLALYYTDKNDKGSVPEKNPGTHHSSGSGLSKWQVGPWQGADN